MVAITTNGLRPDGTSVTALPPIAWGAATGSADVISVTYDPPVLGLYNGLILGFRAAFDNASATPTFNPNGFGAEVITTRGGNTPLAADIVAGGEYLVRYNSTSSRWELLNPSRYDVLPWGEATDTDAISVAYSPAILSLADGTMVGFRAAGANTLTNPTFSPNGLTARTIVRDGGAPLQAGDIPAANAEVLLRYNLTSTRWELLNPAVPVRNTSFNVLAANATGQNVTAVQPWFPSGGAVTLAPGLYELEGRLYTSRAAGTSSHTTSVAFGGTATIGALRGRINCRTGDANAAAADNSVDITSASAVVVKAASTSGTEQTSIIFRGIVRITVAGTLIPQFQYSAAPGGAPTILANSFFKATRLGAAATETQGTWS